MAMKNEQDMLDDYSHLTGWQKNPYAKKLYRGRKILIDDDVAARFEQLADEKGIHVSKLVTATLKDYLERAEIGVDIK